MRETVNLMTQSVKHQLDTIVNEVCKVILGKEHQVRLAVTCLLANGHLLIEDLPGLGKTTLAHSLANVLKLKFQRIQFTSDLLPADILGVSIYQRETESFKFQAGPLFSQVVLADEINRATPKTQSALLEAMEEGQVTVDGKTHQLAKPFFVIATQNPTYQIGTFALPESQLDRFLMKISLGYLDAKAERQLLQEDDRKKQLQKTDSDYNISSADFLILQNTVSKVYFSDALLSYLQQLLEYSRTSQSFQTGLSPRAGLAIKKASQAWAILEGRDYVLPEDLQAVLPSIAIHRLKNKHNEILNAQDIIEQLIHPIAIP